jgi:hypothetical protein
LIRAVFQTIFFSGWTPGTGPLAKSAFIIIDSKEGLKLGAERGCKREEEVEDEDDNRESIPPSSTVDGDLNKSECKSAYQSFCDMVIL